MSASEMSHFWVQVHASLHEYKYKNLALPSIHNFENVWILVGVENKSSLTIMSTGKCARGWEWAHIQLTTIVWVWVQIHSYKYEYKQMSQRVNMII